MPNTLMTPAEFEQSCIETWRRVCTKMGLDPQATAKAIWRELAGLAPTRCPSCGAQYDDEHYTECPLCGGAG